MGKKSRRPHRQKKRKFDPIQFLLTAFELPYPLVESEYNRDDDRQMADFCLKNFLEYTDDGRDSPTRYYIYSWYKFFVLSGDGVWEKRDKKVLKKIAGDESELAYFRADASALLGMVHYDRKSDMESAAHAYEQVIEICESASELEKSRVLPTMDKFKGKTVGEYLTHISGVAQAQLHSLYHEDKIRVIKSDTEVVVMPRSAGNMCDNCHKTKAELGRERLDCCSRCNFEYYCSKACQQDAWKKGHKKLCRAKGDFRVGDQALMDGGKFRIVLCEKCDGDDAWVVNTVSGDNQRTVPTCDLVRLRPALWTNTEVWKWARKENREAMEEEIRRLKINAERARVAAAEAKDKRERLQVALEKALAEKEEADRSLEEVDRSLEEVDRSLEEVRVKKEELHRAWEQEKAKADGIVADEAARDRRSLWQKLWPRKKK